MPKELNHTPVIIIGAGRTGTNMLRDVICSIAGFGTWDCDEINPVWRYGNRFEPTDILAPQLASPKVKNYIRGRFNQLKESQNLEFVVEKTCANSLRLAFVHEVFPEAKYILINRDGRDVAPSAKIRWAAPFELNYTLKKLKQTPLRDLPYYVWKFGINRLKQAFGADRLSFWGPVYPGIDADFKTKSLLEVCALQWQACVHATQADKNQLDANQFIEVKYEQFVNNPQEELKTILEFLGKTSATSEEVSEAVARVSNRSVGSHEKLSKEEQQALNEICEPTLQALNYDNVSNQ
ncbi:sulfotransferase [Gilvibacter sp.]|uniref:sulfotransferase family protein n=1 Tax=Gilvibacter sp. TaxID=2729997 RepID=UPI0025BBCB54|nr:sulfotransferase [Gilvibacter sp.]NQX76869.1 sulfotransferase [Gilvibacter sp.]